MSSEFWSSEFGFPQQFSCGQSERHLRAAIGVQSLHFALFSLPFPMPFVQRVRELASDPSCRDVITFTDGGRTVTVFDLGELGELLLTRYRNKRSQEPQEIGKSWVTNFVKHAFVREKTRASKAYGLTVRLCDCGSFSPVVLQFSISRHLFSPTVSLCARRVKRRAFVQRGWFLARTDLGR